MQPIGADHKIVPSRRGTLKGDIHTVLILFEAADLVAEDHFRNRVRSLEQQAREVAAPDRDEPPTSQLSKDIGPEPSLTLTVVVDNPHLLYVVAKTIEVSRQPHPVGDIVS
jgi:hypothetical protein